MSAMETKKAEDKECGREGPEGGKLFSTDGGEGSMER